MKCGHCGAELTELEKRYALEISHIEGIRILCDKCTFMEDEEDVILQ